MTTSTTAALGRASTTSGPTANAFSQSAEAPPGDGRTSSAKPANTNDVASVTTMSGTFESTIVTPLTAPSRSPMSITTNTIPTAVPSPEYVLMSVAAMQLVS